MVLSGYDAISAELYESRTKHLPIVGYKSSPRPIKIDPILKSLGVVFSGAIEEEKLHPLVHLRM